MGRSSRRRTSHPDLSSVAAMMAVLGLGFMFMSLLSINFEPIEGTVVESALVRTGFKSRYARIRYVYSVNDVEYDNDTFSYGLAELRDQQRILRLYPVGKRVTVYYSTTFPSYSVLEKGFSFGSFGLFIAGVLLFVGIRLFRH